MQGLVVDEKGKLSVRNLSKPDYGDCQALVKILSCGVCNGTDMKLIHRTFKNFDTYPAVLGHEGVGRVIETGRCVTSFQAGDLVLLPFLESDTDGYYPGWGAYSEYAVVGDAGACAAYGMGEGTGKFNESYLAQSVIKPGDKVDAVSASMIITFREVLSAIRRFGWRANESVLIFGAGPVGLCFAKFAGLLGLKTVISVDIIDEKLDAASAMGADYTFNSEKCDVDHEVKQLFPEGMDYVVDAVGINQLINQAMGLIRYNGKICCYGISPKTAMELDWGKAPYNWNLSFVQWPSKREEGEAHSQIMAWINQGVLDPYDFISDIFDFEHILDAFALVEEQKSTTKKIVIRYEKECSTVQIGVKMIESRLFCVLPDYVCTPDGMAVDRHGNLILSCPNFAQDDMSGCIVKIDREGNVTKWFDVPVHPETKVARNMGIAFDDEWNIYLCDNQGWCEKEDRIFKGRILRITADDEGNILKSTVVAKNMEHPNGIRIRNGYMYVTQSYMHPVIREDGKLVSGVYRFNLEDEEIDITNTLNDKNLFATFVTHNPECQYGADGIVFDRDGNLFVGNFGDGEVYKLTFHEDGSLKSNEPFAKDELQLKSTDGMFIDDEGSMFIADFCDNAIVKVTPEGRVERIAQSPDCTGIDGGLDQPGEPIVWNGKLIASCFDLVTGPGKVNQKHELPAVLVSLAYR